MFPQSYFGYEIEDFSKLTKLELTFLKAELDLIIDDIKLGYYKEPRFQALHSGNSKFLRLSIYYFFIRT